MATSSEKKSETLILDKRMYSIFKKALKKATGPPFFVENDSIFINEPQGNIFKVVIYPTHIGFLFDVFRFYGELYQQEKDESKISK